MVDDLSAGLSASSADGANDASVPDKGPFGLAPGSLNDAQSLRWAQDLEQLGRFQQAMSVQSAGDLVQRVDAGRYAAMGVHGPVDLLTQSLGISAAEARRRIALAQTLLPTRDLITGETAAAATQSVLAESFFKGQVSVEQASMISKFVAEASGLAKDGRISDEACNEVEESLVETGQEQGPDFLRHVGNRIMSLLDPDGHKPTPGDLLAKQGVFFREPRRGLIHFDGHMTIEQYETLMVAIGTATNPNKHKDINGINSDQGTDAQHSATDSETDGDGDAQVNTTNPASRAAQPNQTGQAGGGEGAPLPGCESQGTLFEQLNGIIGVFNAAETEKSVEPASTVEPGEPEPSAEHPAEPEKPANAEEPRESELEHPAEPSEQQVQQPDGHDPTAQPGPEQPGAKEKLGLQWQRALEPWEIPPRPESAPPDAVAPVYEGEKWFWVNQATTATQGWDSNQTDHRGQDSENFGSGLFSSSGPFNNSGPLINPEAEGTGATETRIIDGVRIPIPGLGDSLDGLDSRDPDSADPVTKDTRTHGQKLLDGLLDCVKLAARTDKLPLNGGLKTQLIITTSQADLDRRDGTGTAFTTHTGPVPLALFAESLCDPELTYLTMGKGQEILNLGRTQRLFTAPQRKLLVARDLGCSFPDCKRPSPWTEAHHVIPWQEGGETNISNAALLCSHHHTLLHHSCWTMKMIDGTPYFIAPYLIDPSQTPRRNTYHHGLLSKKSRQK